MKSKEDAIAIIKLSKSLIINSECWNHKSIFGELCDPKQTKFSLGCALNISQLQVIGEFQSRNLAMRRVRKMIRKYFLFRHGFHPITDFNRNKNTTHSDVIFLLEKAIESFD